jgi:hypothetical protein
VTHYCGFWFWRPDACRLERDIRYCSLGDFMSLDAAQQLLGSGWVLPGSTAKALQNLHFQAFRAGKLT